MAIQSNDFRSNSLTGTTTVSGGSFAVTLDTNRLILEGDKSFVVRFRKDNPDGTVIATSPTITMTDNTSVDAFFANTATIDEGYYVNFVLQTSNVPNNYAIYYSLSNVAGDFDSNDVVPFEGVANIINNSANILIYANADLSGYLDDNEAFQVKLRTDSVSGDIVASSNTVYIVDTSNSARITNLSLTRNTSLPGLTMYEGERLTANITTVNGLGQNAATFYYSVAGNASVFGSNTGSFVVSDNAGSFYIILETDVLPDLPKEIALEIRANSPSGRLLETSNTITVYNFTSGIYYGEISRIESIYPNTISGYGQDNFLFYVNTTNSYNGEILQYRTTGNATVQTGNVEITDNAGIVSLIVENNSVPKNIGLEIYRDDSYQVLLGESNSSITFVPNYVQFESVEPFDENIVEGEQYLVTVNTQYGRPGGAQSNLYYTVASNGTINSGTFGEFDPAVPLSIIPETNIPEGETRQLQFSIRTDSTSGPIVYTSNLLYVESYESYGDKDNVVAVTSLVTEISSNAIAQYKDASSIYFTVNTIGGQSGETLYWITSGNVVSGDINSGNTGSFSLSSNAGNFTVLTNGNASVDKEYKIQIRKNSISGPLLYETDQTYVIGTYSGPMIAFGGNIETSIASSYRRHVFTIGDNFEIETAAYNPAYIGASYLLVAGGGGATSGGKGGSGGGAGGVQTGTVLLTGKTGSFVANVGAGGGVAARGSNTDLLTLDSSLLALGGGAAGTNPGGSGGGGAAPALNAGGVGLEPTSVGGGYGYPGGSSSGIQPWPTFPKAAGGGGGGASAAGNNGRTNSDGGGAGGNGISSPLAPPSIGAYDVNMSWSNPAAVAATGGTRFFGGGGGGSSEQSNPGTAPGGKGGGGAGNPSQAPGGPGPLSGRPALATSGGGGGAGGHGVPGSLGGTGGSGVIIIQYPFEIGSSGGNVYVSNGYVTHAFTSPGTLTLSANKEVEYIIVGGGGGGGSISVAGAMAGGGGSGGVLVRTTTLNSGSYPVTIGAGGAAGSPGNPSSFNGYTAYGGGSGGTGYPVYSPVAPPYPAGTPGQPGGSGGGAGGAGWNNLQYPNPAALATGGSATKTSAPPSIGTEYGSPGFDFTSTPGFADKGGGGGGAGSTGSEGSKYVHPGGHGIPILDLPPEVGTSGPSAGRWLAGGGGAGNAENFPTIEHYNYGGGGVGYGANSSQSGPAAVGLAGTGGGGGGGGLWIGLPYPQPYMGGAAGGSGIVIVRYPIASI